MLEVIQTPSATPAVKFMAPVIQISVMVTVIVSTILAIFAWPAANATAHNIPIGITSNVPNLIQGVQTQFDQEQPGAFKFIEYKDLAAAKKAIAHRDVYGALVLTDTPQMLIATGASPAIAQMLETVSLKLGLQFTSISTNVMTFPIEDLAPLGSKDPKGLGLTAGSLPLIIAGIVVGLLGSMRLRRKSQKLLVAALAGTLAAFSIVAILNLWLGSLQGNYFLEVFVVALGSAAVSLTVMGAAALAGRAGLLSVIGLFFIVGNPLGGVALPQELYSPTWFGTLGQYLPLGAEVNLLRRISYFPEASTVTQWATLGAWLAVGVLLLVIAPNRKPKGA